MVLGSSGSHTLYRVKGFCRARQIDVSVVGRNPEQLHQGRAIAGEKAQLICRVIGAAIASDVGDSEKSTPVVQILTGIAVAQVFLKFLFGNAHRTGLSKNPFFRAIIFVWVLESFLHHYISAAGESSWNDMRVAY